MTSFLKPISRSLSASSKTKHLIFAKLKQDVCKA